MSDTALPDTALPASRPALASRILARIPVIGRFAREIDRDTDNIFWLLPVLILGLVLGVKFWGLAALTMFGLAMVPLIFAFFIAISWP